MDEELSPALLEKVTWLGAKLPSFRDAHEALDVLLRTKIGLKRVERITERMGGERIAERDAEIALWSQRTLTEKLAAPPGVKPPTVAAVLADGGRLQLREAEPEATSHWHEYKAGVVHSLHSAVSAHDPCPQLPELFLQRERIDNLAREIAKVAAAVEPSVTATTVTADVASVVVDPAETVFSPPTISVRRAIHRRR